MAKKLEVARHESTDPPAANFNWAPPPFHFEVFMQQIAHAFRALAGPVLLAVIIGMSGCVVAIPYPHHRTLEGSEITAQSLQDLHVNQTTRTQVLEKFGSPDIDFVGQRVIAYAWSGIGSKVLIVAASLGGGNADSQMLSRERSALLVRFDSEDRVVAFSIIDRPIVVQAYDPLEQSSDAHLDDWRAILGQWLASQPRIKE